MTLFASFRFRPGEVTPLAATLPLLQPDYGAAATPPPLRHDAAEAPDFRLMPEFSQSRCRAAEQCRRSCITFGNDCRRFRR